jgi:putative membrane protein
MTAALFQGTFLPPDSGMDMDRWMWTWQFHLGSISFILIIAFYICAVIAIAFLIRWLAASARRKKSQVKPGDQALEILRMRYAKGEINREEFEEKKKDLGY